MRNFFITMSFLLLIMIAGCGYNSLQTNDEQIKSSWSQLTQYYQRRADLVPQLVDTIKGIAAQDREVLWAVFAAQERVDRMTASPELLNKPQEFLDFQAAHKALADSVAQLVATAEKYPAIKSDSKFRALQTLLNEINYKIVVEQQRYTAAVKDYNATVRSFPSYFTAQAMGFRTKPNFSDDHKVRVAGSPRIIFVDGKNISSEQLR